MVRILCVMDNVVSGNKGLKAQHGLSFYLEAGGKKLLFDFGQGRDTWENGKRLGVPFHLWIMRCSAIATTITVPVFCGQKNTA